MKFARKLALIIGFSGTIVFFGNYLWLVGFTAKPAQELFEARMWYSGVAYTVAFICLIAGEMP